ncbi:MAG: anaerobic ribonucleoside-triphosphate reductase activating protein [Ruminococcaceae bacterium]|nr:anaerobic ribonucleoside-triphosphate reductase activating protein [Oscillospiraceae bacterium]
MIIKGLQKLTLLDFPDKIACTLFTFGCNFRCPFCHNASLVLTDRTDESVMPEEEFFTFLARRRGMLQGVCITGGEPTLQPDLPAFIARIKDMGYAVKLDTNGYRPEVLRRLTEAGLLDYVAMDIKNSLPLYGKTVGIESFDTRPVEESMDYLMENRVPFEFRTTLVRGLHTVDSIRTMGERLAGPEPFFLQAFKDSGDLICGGMEGISPSETRAMLDVLRRHIPNAQIRGE